MVGQGKARHGMELGEAWYGEARQGKAGPGKEQGTERASQKTATEFRKDILMKRYKITLTGLSDLLMHKDNITWSERVRKWQKDPANKPLTVAGDDRSPGWAWMGYVYHHGGLVCIESDNLMSMLRDAGKKIPGERKNSSLKAITQAGIIVNEVAWPMTVRGAAIGWKAFDDLKLVNDFDQHEERAKAHGFELFVKRAKVGQAKHIRVRPRFEEWEVSGTITVTEESLKKSVIQDVLNMGGARVGLGDWRPGSPQSPGPFGKFTSTVEEIK